MSHFKCMLIFSFVFACCHIAQSQQVSQSIIPAPKELNLSKEKLCIADGDLSFYAEDPELNALYEVIKKEFLTITGHDLPRAASKNNCTFLAAIDPSMEDEEYSIEIDDIIKIAGGSYNAVAMASITVLQSMKTGKKTTCWNKGSVKDYPDFSFRGVLVDLARKKHDIATIKRVIMLCRWYKINYLQLHLTDSKHFTFPSEAYPQLSTENWVYSKEELKDLVSFADKRGVEIIPELEVPGHAGQLVKNMPGVFGFSEENLNHSTINMGRERAYTVLDTLIGEIAKIFNTSEYIHIGSDEANFEGMEKDAAIQDFMSANDLENMEELYWYFINKMNESVRKRGKKTIVWEGFSKEGNKVIDKNITVMAWETKYQLPQDILAAGYTTINVSWKPLYVVNQRKWSPEKIFNWNIYRWENFVPSIPSYVPIQLDKHPGIIGASMASWEQPAHVEISSLRERIPAMVEEAWNHSRKSSYQIFKENLEIMDKKLNAFLTPVRIEVEGLSYPEVEDGRKNKQTWFEDQIVITLSGNRNLDIRYSLDNTPVTKSSPKYENPLEIKENIDLRYNAFKNGQPIGIEMLKHFELHPLRVDLSGKFLVPLDSLWETTHPNVIKYQDSVKINLTSKKEGEVRFVIGEKDLNSDSQVYSSPLAIKDNNLVKAGLFINSKLVGMPWIQKFRKE